MAPSFWGNDSDLIPSTKIGRSSSSTYPTILKQNGEFGKYELAQEYYKLKSILFVCFQYL